MLFRSVHCTAAGITLAVAATMTGSDPERVSAQIATDLRSGKPSIWTMDHRVADDELWLELVPLRQDEFDVVTERLYEVLSRPK